MIANGLAKAAEARLIDAPHPPDLHGYARQLVAVEPQSPQQWELPDLRWDARQLIVP